MIPTILVGAAVATMIALGVWQLGRAEEKQALIARYEAARDKEGLSFIKPSAPEAAYTRVIQFCADPTDQRATTGRNAKGESGWVHVSRCTIGGEWPRTEENCGAHMALLERELGLLPDATARRKAVKDCLKPDPELAADLAALDNVLEPAEVVLGWSRSSDPVAWDGGHFAGTVVPTGELGFRIVADPPLAGLEPNARPDPGDLPNNHLAYAGQWFFFALTALVIYGLALRARMRSRIAKPAPQG
jgi:surfeit locus 1 family protein